TNESRSTQMRSSRGVDAAWHRCPDLCPALQELARGHVADATEDAMKLGIAAEPGAQRRGKQRRPALLQQRVDAIQAQAIPVLDQRHTHLRLEDAGEPADADLEPMRDRADVDL